jgi:zinc protease
LQFSNQIATYAGSFYRPVSLDDTTFNLIVVPRPGVSLQEAEDAMDVALAKFLEEGVDPEQLERIKFQTRANQVYARDDVDRIGNRYGQALTSGLTVEDEQAWPDILQAVTADDIMAAAREVLDRRKSVTGWLMSEEITQ